MAAALLGGILIGTASGLIFLLLGRIAGITGIITGSWPAPRRWWTWRAAFLAGLVLAGAVGARLAPDRVTGSAASLPLALVAGLLVGFGARYGGGCTSGHGVCGVGRAQSDSIVATMTFVVFGILTASLIRWFAIAT